MLTSGTFLNKRRAIIDEQLKAQFGAETFELPTFATIANEDTELIEYFDLVFQSSLPSRSKEGTAVRRTTRVFQGMALEGAFFAWNPDTDTMELYTANADILRGIEGGHRFDLSKALADNVEGNVYCMRLDPTFINASGEYTLKAVQLTSKRKLSAGRCLFVPYIIVVRFMYLLNKLMKAGRVLEVVINQGTVEKNRLITTNTKVLDYFNGGLHAEEPGIVDVHVAGRVYAPVVGAPLTTLGMTAIKLDSLDYISAIRSNDVSIEKPDNSVTTLIRGELLSIFVNTAFASEDGKQKSKLRALLKSYGHDMHVNASRLDYVKTIQDLDSSLRDDLWSRLPKSFIDYGERLENRLFVTSTPEGVPSNSAELRNMLREGLYRIVTFSSKGTFSMMYATNNTELLTIAYGTGYEARYESEGYRRSRLREAISAGEPLSVAAKQWCFPDYVNVDIDQEAEIISELFNSESAEGSNTGSSSSVMARTLFHSLSNERSSFYRTIYPERIYSMHRLDS